MRSHAGRLIVWGLILAGGCREPAPMKPALVLTGSPPLAPLVKEIGQRFAADHPGVRIDVEAVSTVRGITDAQQGLADVGMVGRPLRSDEAGLQSFPLARDAVCLIVPRGS